MKCSTKLKLLLVSLLVLLCSFSAYSQDTGETPMMSSVLIQLHQISIQQAKQSDDPQTALETEFTLIVNELEQTYLQREKELEAKYQAKLTEQEQNSEKRVNEVQEKADRELAIIQFKLSVYKEQEKSDFWESAGAFGSGFSLGTGLAAISALIYFASVNSQ